jgi:predicted lipid-binding transport protein (Tim44 family)
LLLGLLAVVAFRFLMRRFAPASNASGLQLAGGATAGRADDASAASAIPSASGGFAAPAASTAAALPSDFDAAAFERIAKMIFIRLQAANDVGDLDDLRTFTTPEMFAAIRLDLQDRANAPQRTDVVRVDAQVLDIASEEARQIVSVRFNGLIREQPDAPAEPFDEVWHLVRPADGSRDWAIAGIQPSPQLAGV